MENSEVPEKFSSIMIDFVSDLNRTFPEYKSLWWVYSDETSDAGWKDLYNYCLTVYPERFFDILYQNEDVFEENSTHNVNFLPNTDFRKLFNCTGVTESTKNSLWKYLQLILFTVIGNVKDKNEFGETMNLFEGVDEEELQTKLTEAMKGLGDFFQQTSTDGNEEGFSAEDASKKMEDFFTTMNEEMGGSQQEGGSDGEGNSSNFMPNPDDLHSHLRGLFGGKLGSLAKELMEELGGDLEETLGINASEFGENAKPMDIMKKLMRQPDKIMKLVQKVQGKFQEKMNSGDLSQEDLMKEAGDMLRKMKEMGGNSKQMHEMFQNLAKNMGGSSKNMRMDTGKLDRMMKSQETRERMRAKLEKKRQDAAQYALENKNNQLVYRPEGIEKAEKTKLTDVQLNDLVKEFDTTESNIVQDKNKKKSKKSKKKK